MSSNNKDKEEKKSSESSTPTTTAPAVAHDLGLLEEDDEFEEFPAEGERRQDDDVCAFIIGSFFAEWDGKDEDQEDANVWDDNWDDDTVEDDFSVQLK